MCPIKPQKFKVFLLLSFSPSIKRWEIEKLNNEDVRERERDNGLESKENYVL